MRTEPGWCRLMPELVIVAVLGRPGPEGLWTASGSSDIPEAGAPTDGAAMRW